jgi:hypothetical protein
MMLLSDLQISDYLKQHRLFAECIVEDVLWQHYGTIIDIVIQYIWLDDGTVRPAYLPRVSKTLRFHVVQELRLVNGLNVHTSLRPDAINWGLSEVAAVRLLDDEGLLNKYRHLPISAHHIALLWEGTRRIDIVFSTLEIL